MGRFLKKLMGAQEVKPLLSDGHFSVDGTLLQAWASHASLERIDGQEDPPPPPSGPGEGFGQPKPGRKRAKGDFRGVRLSNKTHRSSTDPVDAVFSEGVALLARKSNAHPAQPGYRGHVLMDNRHALIVDCRVTQAVGGYRDDRCRQELRHQGIRGRDAAYGVTPHVVQNAARPGGSAINGQTTHHKGYAKSVNARRGIKKVGAVFGPHVIACNLIRLGNLLKSALEAA